MRRAAAASASSVTVPDRTLETNGAGPGMQSDLVMRDPGIRDGSEAAWSCVGTDHCQSARITYSSVINHNPFWKVG